MHVPIIDASLQRRLLARGSILCLPTAQVASHDEALGVLDSDPDPLALTTQTSLQASALAILASALRHLPASEAVRDQAMLDLRVWCQRHCREHPDRERVAQVAGLSVPQLHRRFRAAFGESPTAWLERCRLAIAQRLLRTATLPVHEVATAAGYEDPYHFSRVFARRIGMPPSRFARQTGP